MCIALQVQHHLVAETFPHSSCCHVHVHMSMHDLIGLVSCKPCCVSCLSCSVCPVQRQDPHHDRYPQ